MAHALLIALAAAPTQDLQRTHLRVGDPAPDFSAVSHDGKSVSLEDYRGKKLMLWFYPRAGTGGWTAEGRAFEAARSDFAAKNVAIVGCSNDPLKANAKFAADNHFDFPLLSDASMKVAVDYGAAKHRHTKSARRIAVLIDEKGIISKVYDPAGTATFPAEVLADLKKEEL